MSSVFVPQQLRGNKPAVTQETIQKLLDENSHLIQCIVDHQSTGDIPEASQYQQILHRNLVWLATVADSNQSNAQNLLSQTSPRQSSVSALQPPDGKSNTPQTSESPGSNTKQPQVTSVAATIPSQPAQQLPPTNSGQPTAPTDSQLTPGPQMFSAPQEHAMQPQAKAPYTQPHQQMQGTYPPQYPPSSYPTSMPHRAQQDPSQALVQQASVQHPQQPALATSLPQYSQQGMMQSNPGMVASTPGSYPANYPMTTSQGMQQQQYQMAATQGLAPPDQQRQQYGRLPPGQEPGGYPAYSAASGHQMPVYPPQNQQQQNTEYAQYSNTEHQQMQYQQYQQQ